MEPIKQVDRFITFKRHKWVRMFGNEKAMVLPTALVFMGVLALLGTTAFVTSSTEMKIGNNHKISEQAFYVALAGGEEARARLAGYAANPVVDGSPSQSGWRVYIGSLQEATDNGYNPSSSLHVRYDCLAADFGYTVQIRHRSVAAGNLLYWGDNNGDGLFERNTVAGKNIYLVTSLSSVGGSNKSVETEIAEIPPITVPAALYVEAATTIQGGSTYVIGVNSCGGPDKAGLVTTGGAGSVTVIGGVNITGSGGSTPNILYNGTDMDVGVIVGFLKRFKDFSYTVVSATHSPATVPGPGDSWGTPTLGATLQDASSCACSNIVNYDTSGTYVKLSGGVSGCGILLIEGDLEIAGDFAWYGPVIVTGSVVFSGGGNRNITGAMIVGGSVVCDVSGGNSNIIYCSAAIKDQTENRPLQLLSWREDV